MAHKTFVSYKYSEAIDLRDRILDALGDDVTYYKGETSDSPDLTDTSTDNIKRKLSDMMYDTSVTIVIISPNMKDSKWIDWEIEYSLKTISRKGRTSNTNGVVGVIMKYNGGYSWIKTNTIKADGCTASSYDDRLTYPIIYNNRYNQDPKKYCCDSCKTVDYLSGSYISYIEEESFLEDPNKYIDSAYEKSENDASGYKIVKTR